MHICKLWNNVQLYLLWLCFSILHLLTAKLYTKEKDCGPLYDAKKFSFVKATQLWEAILTLRAVLHLYYLIAIYFSEPGKWGQRELIYWSPNKLKRNKQHKYTYFFTYRKHAVWKLPWTYMKFSTRAPNWDTWVINEALSVEEKANLGC